MSQNIPNLAFKDGQYDLRSKAKQLAAAEAALAAVSMIPMAYHSRGAEFCQNEMARVANEFLYQLKQAQGR